MEIYLQATIGICSEYMETPNTEKTAVSIVIAPNKATAETDSKVRLVSGCNLWQSCQNVACWYSLACREKKKARSGK